MEPLFFGSQFPLDNLDPALRDLDAGQEFFQDADFAMETSHSAAPPPTHQHADVSDSPLFGIPSTVTYHYPGTLAYRPPAEQSDPPHNGGFRTVTKKRRNQKKRLRPNTTSRTGKLPAPKTCNQLRVTPPAVPSWQDTNPYALLNPEEEGPSLARDYEQNAGFEAAARHTPRSADNSGYGSPMTGEAFYSGPFTAGSPYRGPVIPDSRPMDAAGGSRVHAPVVNPRPGFGCPQDWTIGVYNTGDRIQHSQGNLPPTPKSSNPPRSRVHDTPSVTFSVLTCETCHKAFSQKHKLNHHRRYHEQRTYHCALCPKAFTFGKDLLRHMATHDKSQRHLFCNIMGCKYNHVSFTREDNLKRHVEQQHRGGMLSPPATSSLGGA